jgi:hypothetical protein
MVALSARNCVNVAVATGVSSWNKRLVHQHNSKRSAIQALAISSIISNYQVILPLHQVAQCPASAYTSAN